jgi:SAM-dependent methyltransferase
MLDELIPSDHLLTRIGISPEWLPDPEERRRAFWDWGKVQFDDVIDGAGFTDWDGRRILDFGCGSGRVLQHLAGLVEQGAELVGCDIHEETVAWTEKTYDGIARVYANQADPPLPDPDDSYDLIVAGSVFSHLVNWAPWLLEMRRVLKPGGRLVASIHGRGLWPMGVAGARGEPWDEDATGLLVERSGDSFDRSWGPAVYFSEWWLRAHWGRAVEILRYEPSGFAHPDERHSGQAWVVVSPKDADVTVADLEAPSDDPRELAAALRAQRLAYDEIALTHYPTIYRLMDDAELGRVRYEGELESLRTRLAEVKAGHSNPVRLLDGAQHDVDMLRVEIEHLKAELLSARGGRASARNLWAAVERRLGRS